MIAHIIDLFITLRAERISKKGNGPILTRSNYIKRGLQTSYSFKRAQELPKELPTDFDIRNWLTQDNKTTEY